MLRAASRIALACAAAAFGLSASSTFAGPVSTAPVLQLRVESSTTGSDYVAEQQGSLDGDGETYTHIGNGNGVQFNVSWDMDVNPDPFIVGTFNLTNLSTTTEEFLLTITLPTTPLAGPNVMGGSFGVVTVTDANQDSTVTISTVGASPFYEALVDGASVQTLGSFNVTTFGGPGIQGTIAPHALGTPIPSDPAPAPAIESSVGTSIHFELSGGDRVSIPIRFEVTPVPEPGALPLVGLGIAALLFRRQTSHSRWMSSGSSA